jgi:hypothetical protein
VGAEVTGRKHESGTSRMGKTGEGHRQQSKVAAPLWVVSMHAAQQQHTLCFGPAGPGKGVSYKPGSTVSGRLKGRPDLIPALCTKLPGQRC